MGEHHKINDTGGGATASLIFRFLTLVFILNVVAVLAALLRFSFTYFYLAEIAILAFAFIIYASKREAEKIQFEGGKIIITGKRFFFFKFKNSASYSKVKYKFKKPAESKNIMFWFLQKKYRIELYKDNRKWVDITGGPMGWSRIRIGDLAKTLIARGCYNWFEFNKRKRK